MVVVGGGQRFGADTMMRGIENVCSKRWEATTLQGWKPSQQVEAVRSESTVNVQTLNPSQVPPDLKCNMRLSRPAGGASPVHKYAFTRIYTFRSNERRETVGSVAQLHADNLELV